MTPAPGWYADPTAAGRLRWWDGRSWTEHVQPVPSDAPVAVAPAPDGPVWPLESGPRSADGVALAGWWQRARGHLVDATLLWSVSLLLFGRWHDPLLNELLGLWRVWLLVGLGPGGLADWFTADLLRIWLVAMLPGALLRIGYDMACLVSGGATLGHRAVGVRVAPRGAAPGAAPANPEAGTGLAPARALVRSLVLRLTAPTGVLWLVVVLWAAVDRRRQGLHDLAAGTQVVEHRWAPGQLG